MTRPVMMQSLETESLAFVILKFNNILRHLPATHVLQKEPKIVHKLSQEMETVGDVIQGLRAEFAIPVAIKLKTHGGALLQPGLHVKALTYFSDTVRVEPQLGEYTTRRTSNDGEDVVPPPPPESNNQESIEAIADHPDSGMSESESDKENDNEIKELARKVNIPGPSKAISLAERARHQSEGTHGMAQVRTRQNICPGTPAIRSLLQDKGMNSSDMSGTKSSPGSSSKESHGLRRLERVAADPNLCDIAKGKRKLSLNDTEDQADSATKKMKGSKDLTADSAYRSYNISAAKDAKVVKSAEDIAGNVENAIQPQVVSCQPTSMTAMASTLQSQQTSRSGFDTIKYEDVKPRQIIKLKVKKEDGKDLRTVMVTIIVSEVQDDCIKGKLAVSAVKEKEIKTFGRSTIEDIKVFKINGKVKTYKRKI